jgi:hypothetical protein
MGNIKHNRTQVEQAAKAAKAKAKAPKAKPMKKEGSE